MRGSSPLGQPPARRWLALGILCAASFMVILDGTIVTVALPVIQADLGFTAGNLSWVMTAYLIAFGGLLLLGGRLGDLLGRKRLFLAGIAVFVLASLACGLAAAPWMLIAARFVQGGGAAMASAVTLGMIVRLFDSPAEQNRAMGAFAFTGAAGASAGLILGGLLVQYASWHWIFFVNLPAGALTALAAWRVLSGIGGGLALPALTVLGMAGATDADAGVISGVFNTTQQAGGALGVAVLTALASARSGGGTSAPALTSGYHLAWLVGTGLGVASIAVAATVLLPRRGSWPTRNGVRADAPDGAACTAGQAAVTAAATGRPAGSGCRTTR
jgi:MFS family permease